MFSRGLILGFIWLLTNGIARQNYCNAQNTDSLKTVWNDDSQLAETRLGAANVLFAKKYLFNHSDSALNLAYEMSQLAESGDLQVWKAKSKYAIATSSYLLGSYDSAVVYYEYGLDDFAVVQDTVGMAKCLNGLGVIHYNQGDYENAYRYYNESLEMFLLLSDDKGIARAYNNLGGIFQEQGDHNRAIDYYSKSFEIKSKQSDQRGMGKTLVNIGMLYYFQEDTAMALEKFHESLELMEAIDDERGQASCLEYIGTIRLDQGNLEVARGMFHKALVLNERTSNPRGKANVMSNLGNVFNQLGQGDSTLYWYTKSLDIRREMDDKQGQAISLVNLSNFYLDQSELEKSKISAGQALQLGQELDAVTQQKEAALALYEVFSALGDKSSALEYHELHVLLKDSLARMENQRALIRSEFEKSIRSVSDQNEELEKENSRQSQTILILSLAVLFIIISGGSIYQSSRKKNALLLDQLQTQIKEYKDKLESAKNSQTIKMDVRRINDFVNQKLTDRELEVLELWIEDISLTRKELAEKLFIGMNGLKSRIRSIFLKLKVNSKEKAVLTVIENLKSSD